MESTKRFIGLDGLRAIFCIGIVIYHVNAPFDAAFSKWLEPVYKYGGYFGNYMFFMLSGLLTAFHYKYKIINQECNFRSFMAKRIVKIYPLYFFSNLFALILGGTIPDAKRIITTFLMISNGWFDGKDMPYNFPTWFLCILILQYILYCAIGKVSTRIPQLYFALCVFFMIWGMLLVTRDWNVPFNYKTCGEGYMNFFLGVLLAELLMSSSINKQILTAVNLIAFSAIMIHVYLFGVEAMPRNGFWVFSCFCANLVCMALYGNYLVRLLAFPPLQTIGKCSFSIYLWHIPIVRAYLMIEKKFHLFNLDPRWNFILYFVILISLSILSYYYLEKRFGSLLLKGQCHLDKR